ncbi:NAD(P)H-dependent flavin oxidoreductase [Loigolactobacillus coryniformis]|uniref:NAD(P)H-dependent flavin oxidoreductase n=1 Tax=Loigolactobacillus coryniformis TaxID=1610 RepID=UPI001C5D776C|nr:nitronate monooxygenase [Loigolactobacillus coryniformis]MBW4803305.1 nitronate monooxygenase [Loigolactobacillus coryniformis subsp. torquens]MBW4806001.1 nitronate monooxygenase [Loigolactobacillus coryniformis subsp. torquens]
MANRLATALGIEVPFIQGPMSWLTNAEFVAAVSNAGGLGILGPNAGQTEIIRDALGTAEHMRQEIRKVKKLTTKPFAVTLIGGQGGVTSDFTLKILDVVIEEEVPIALVNTVGAMTDGSYGIEPTLLAPLKANGIKLVVRSWQPSIKDALAVQAQGADVYVATGFDEGGTLPEKTIGSFSLIPMIADAIDMPLALAGGVADSRGVRAALALGADGVYVGTRLIPTFENSAHPKVKQLIVDSTAEDLKIFRTAPAYYRSLPTNVREQMVANDNNLSKQEAWTNNAALMQGGSGMRLGMLEGNFDTGYVSVGTGISMIHKVQSVAEVVAELMADFK